MDRRKSIKTLAVGIIATGVLVKSNSLAVDVLNKPAHVSFAN